MSDEDNDDNNNDYGDYYESDLITSDVDLKFDLMKMSSFELLDWSHVDDENGDHHEEQVVSEDESQHEVLETFLQNQHVEQVRADESKHEVETILQNQHEVEKIFGKDGMVIDYDKVVKKELQRARDSNQNAPIQSMLLFQIKLLKVFTKGHDAKTGKVKELVNVQNNAKDIIALYRLANILGLGNAEGDILINCIKEILHNNNLAGKISLPEHIRSVNEACIKHFHKINFTFYRRYYPLPTQIFGHDVNPREGTSLDLLEVLGDALLRATPGNVLLKPNPVYKKIRGVQTRVYKEFMSCELAERVCNWVNQRFGENSYPLFLGIMYDGVAANTSKTRSHTPLSCVIMNCINNDLKPHLLGYMPVHSSYSDEELYNMLQRKGCSVMERMDELTKNFDRECQLNFIHDIMKMTISTHEDGILAQIGSGTDARIVKLHIFVVKFLGDIVGLDVCTNCGFHRKMFCRICHETDRWDFSSVIMSDYSYSFRDANETETASLKMSQMLRNMFLHDCSKQKGNYRKTDDEIHWKEIAELKSISWTRNPLFELFRTLSDAGLWTFHKAFGPELLHVLRLGLEKKLASTVVSLISIYSKFEEKIIRPSKLSYANSMSTLDKRIKDSPLLLPMQTFFPVKRAIFRNGISSLIDSKATDKSNSAYFAGSLYAWQYDMLIMNLQLILATVIYSLDPMEQIRDALFLVLGIMKEIS